MSADLRQQKEAASAAMVAQYSGAVMTVFMLGTICWGLRPHTGYLFSALLYLMAIVLAGTRWNRGPVLLMAILSALAWNFVFIPPHFTLHIDRLEDVFMFVLFFVVALGMGHLITQLRGREEALQQHHAEREALLAEAHRAELLAESERLHRTLLDSVSHELKTPIAIIRTALDGLGEGNAYATEIDTATRRLQRIVDNFLEMTRVETEALTPRPDWCEMSDVLHTATSPLMREFQAYPLKITGIDNMPLLRLDGRLLGQALGNILHNATNHAPPGTVIEVSVQLDPHKAGEGDLQITVRDHGPGLPHEETQRVFEKFYRAPGSAVGGTGLGLPIARGLMRALKGDLTATNHPEGGACFTLQLPVQIHQDPP